MKIDIFYLNPFQSIQTEGDTHAYDFLPINASNVLGVKDILKIVWNVLFLRNFHSK